MDLDWLQNGTPADGLVWHGQPDPTTQRAIVDSNQHFRKLWYLEKALEAARSVGYVGFNSKPVRATCFLVGPQLILTNHHVFGSSADADDAYIQFGYQERFNGDLTDPARIACDTTLFVTDQALDFSLVALATNPGLPYLNLRHAQAPALESHIAIIQHPSGAPLQVAMRDHALVWADDRFIQYLTNTEYGSSGSPVFDDYWQVIALHSQRVRDPKEVGSIVWYRNQGTRMQAILNNPTVDSALPLA
jgi:endonuclease G